MMRHPSRAILSQTRSQRPRRTGDSPNRIGSDASAARNKRRDVAKQDADRQIELASNPAAGQASIR
jgi:hypothetical protein